MSSNEGMLVPILAGAVLGVAFAMVGRLWKGTAEVRLPAFGLVAAALVYVVLALVAADARWLAVETTGVVLFGALAWLGARASLWWLMLGWVAHVGWDVGLHLDRPQPVVGPEYPLACVGFDLVVAGFLLAGAASGRAARA